MSAFEVTLQLNGESYPVYSKIARKCLPNLSELVETIANHVEGKKLLTPTKRTKQLTRTQLLAIGAGAILVGSLAFWLKRNGNSSNLKSNS
jgi:hypothetical protein